jgi:hypothetical protein
MMTLIVAGRPVTPLHFIGAKQVGFSLRFDVTIKIKHV